MIKQIHASQLAVGMFIHELNCQSQHHPFAPRFKLTSDEEVEHVRAACLSPVYIDTAKGLDVPDAPTLQEAMAALEDELNTLAAGQCMLPIRATFAEEMLRAKTIKEQAQRKVSDMMHDVRLGKMIRLDDIETEVEGITDSILRNPGALTALSQIRNKDDYTFLHSVSVGALLVSFCVSAGMDQETIRQAGLGGLLHDAGKACVPDEVLNKPGKLTKEEFIVMQNHPAYGFELLSAIPGIGPIPLDIAHHHHERFNGDGYPDRIAGDKIDRLTQMAAIVDVYDSVTSSRAYHPGMSPAAALRMLLEWGKSHFDPKLVQDFMRCVGFYPNGTLVLLESGRLGVVVEQHESNLMTPKVKVFYDTRKSSPLPVQVVDLGAPLGAGGGDRIVSHESAERWKVEPGMFLGDGG
ncbi:MAG: HD-GYP domain-containing protein [Oxalobacter sp.]|nr:MAG: HD-GYP domain-containing protein [Oxalobacter sp.]